MGNEKDPEERYAEYQRINESVQRKMEELSKILKENYASMDEDEIDKYELELDKYITYIGSLTQLCRKKFFSVNFRMV